MKWHFCVFFFITIYMCPQTREPESADLVSKKMPCRECRYPPAKTSVLVHDSRNSFPVLTALLPFNCLFWREKRGVPKTMIAFEVFVQQIDDFNLRELLVYFEFRLFFGPMFFLFALLQGFGKVNHKRCIQICCEKSWSFSGNTSSKPKICCRK